MSDKHPSSIITRRALVVSAALMGLIGIVPGMPNLHSHAFQRAFAGLAERRDSGADDFWSWRDRMYGVALRITPAQLKAIARQLYLELLQGGYRRFARSALTERRLAELPPYAYMALIRCELQSIMGGSGEAMLHDLGWAGLKALGLLGLQLQIFQGCLRTLNRLHHILFTLPFGFVRGFLFFQFGNLFIQLL